jgi:putative phosphoribosyl transferase
MNPELAIGAVSETGYRWVDTLLAREVGASEEYVQREVEAQMAEAERRKREYRITATREAVEGKIALVVDDGIATGASTLVGVESARGLAATEVVLAAPVASPPAIELLEPLVDRLVVLAAPDPFLAVGMHYQQFSQVGDAEVIRYLELAEEQPLR